MNSKKSVFFIMVFLSGVATCVRTAQAADTSVTPAANNVSDEELILDDGDIPPPAAAPEKRPPVPPAATPASSVDAAASAARQVPKTQPVRDTAKQKVIDEELILDGGAEDLLGQEKAKTKADHKTAGTDKADSTTGTDSTATAASPGRGDSATSTPGEETNREPRRPLTSDQPVASVTVPAKVEKPHSIYFARNLKEYRSPKLAMLMSLIVPGSGQIYSRSSLWAAAFAGIEAVVIGAGWTFIAKAKIQKKNAYSYADDHYSADKFKNYCGDLKAYLQNAHKDSLYYQAIFYDSSDASFLAEAQKGPGGRSDDFYTSLTSGQSSPYIRGWDDVEPDFGNTGFPHGDPSWAIDTSTGYLVHPKNDPNNRGYGFSDHQAHYSQMISESHRLSRIGGQIYKSLLFNHIASAVAAGIAAKRHNDELLSKESFWRRIDIEQNFVNTGSETVTGYALGVRF